MGAKLPCTALGHSAPPPRGPLLIGPALHCIGRSVRNALKALGYEVKDVEKASDIANADKLVFPGVGTYGQAMGILKERGYVNALKDYIAADK